MNLDALADRLGLESSSTFDYEIFSDMAKFALRKWVEFQDLSKFLTFLTNFQRDLDIGGDSSFFPTPSVYSFPYPKPPPISSAMSCKNCEVNLE